MSSIGFDFGTTNSSIARVDESGEIELAQFAFQDEVSSSSRSLLYFEKAPERGSITRSWTGREAIEHYLAPTDGERRLIQSLKSMLTSRTLQSTEVFGRRVTLEDLVAKILRDIRERAEAQFGTSIRAITAGRPVRFVGAENDADDKFAEARLEKAFHNAGFESVEFVMEPIAAANHYESTLDHDELILIGDFGGGTSDFSLVHAGPGVAKGGREHIIGNAGLGLAGDAFDAKIVRHLVSPALGAGTEMRSLEKILPVPGWVYAKLERWHHLSFLKGRDTMNMLASVQANAFYPDRIEALIHLIKEDLGYHLHQAVQRLKTDLSAQPTARFRFSDYTVDLDESVERDDFEKWIADELRLIENCVDELLRTHHVEAGEVDMVFLTGGTSFVPSVRQIFESRFGANKIQAGNEFTSIARGLALSPRQRRTSKSARQPRSTQIPRRS